MNAQHQTEEFDPIGKPRVVDYLAWAHPTVLLAFSAATIVLCAVFNKSAFALQRAQYWESAPFALKAALIGALGLIVISPVAIMFAAVVQLKNDDSELKLRFQHFGMTLAGVIVAILALAFFQPGIMDGFADGDWAKLFFGG